MILFNKQKQYFNNTALMQHVLTIFGLLIIYISLSGNQKKISCSDPRLISSGKIWLTSTSQTEAGHLNHHWRPQWPEVSWTHNVLISGDSAVVHSPESIPNLFIIDCEVTTVSHCRCLWFYYLQTICGDVTIHSVLQWPVWILMIRHPAQATTSCTEIQTIITIIGLLHYFLLNHFLFCFHKSLDF